MTDGRWPTFLPASTVAWSVGELRDARFAQALGVKGKVSPTRITKELVRHLDGDLD